ncbi:hypothetical protein HPB47_009557 [Ixodes persulcatus]|uniref:Uncharacterized protein n=1 Tax=Ixodes persulcatus TaxID=34615 RepID=A0AC60P1V3_IXOPE|nr:hypothetical protein HPB47_009557 [Ixodes persulcatus]
MVDESRQRVTAAQREKLDTFMFENPSLVRSATELSPALSRDDKVRLWTKLSSRLNYLGPPRKEPVGWKRYWAVRVSKARARAAELAKQARQTGGGGGRVRSLASSYARILTLVGEDWALGAPGFSAPAFEDEAEGRPASAQAGHGQQAAEPVPSTSPDVRPPSRPRVRPTAPRATPRISRQERHDEAAMQAVANQTLQLQQNEARDARDVEFQGQLLRSIETLSHRMEAVAEANQEQARATQAVALELQNTTRVLVEVERYRDCLRVLCFARATDQQAAERSFGFYLRSAGQMTEFLGPKFTFEPHLPPPEKLSLVRGLAERALSQDRERCIADGVDALCRTTGQRPKSLKMGAIVEHFKCANLKLLASDKEGGFVVLPHELYTKKAKEAVDKNFKPVKPGSLNKELPVTGRTSRKCGLSAKISDRRSGQPEKEI